MGYYAQNGTRIDTNTIIAKYTSAAINGRFKGMNVLTTLDALPLTTGFEAYTSAPLTGYKWGGTQINFVELALLRRNINNCSSVTSASTSGKTYTNALSYPRVFYVMFQAAGGAGGADSTGTGTGGGSGSYTLSKVVLQPGSSFKVTHYSTYAKCELVTGTAYMNAGYRTAGYSFNITASAGTAGGPNNAGVGFRSGGKEERDGVSINANSLSNDAYKCPAYAIYGGQAGQNRVSYSSNVENGRGGGGGGASAGPYLRDYSAQRTGGGGAFYYKDTYHTYSNPATAGIYGGGGGGGEAPLGAAAGGPSVSFVFF